MNPLRPALGDAADAGEEATAELRERLAEVHRHADEVREQFSERIERLRRDLAAAMKPPKRAYDEIVSEIRDREDRLEVDLPERPEGEVRDVASEWLFDSTRSYFEQLPFYKRHKSDDQSDDQ